MNLKDAHVLVIGAGKSGLGAARLLLASGAYPVIYDANVQLDIEKIREELNAGNKLSFCLGELTDAVLNQRPIITSVSSVLMGEHGCRGVASSVPSVVGPAGVQQRIREKWAPEEYRGFFDAVEKTRDVLTSLRKSL